MAQRLQDAAQTVTLAVFLDRDGLSHGVSKQRGEPRRTRACARLCGAPPASLSGVLWSASKPLAVPPRGAGPGCL